jgi:ubiquinone/menaquinone biosynthesis C-methylase UbiE
MSTTFDNRTYWNERLKEHYDLIGVGDISLSKTYNKWSYKVTRKILRRLFLKYADPKDQQVMDIGAGTGFVVDIWKELGKQVTGVDISETAVKNLQKRFPQDKFVEFDMGSARLDLPDHSFGCISASSVLYHIVEDSAFQTALANIHRLLKKDGFFIFSDNFIHDAQFDIQHQKCRTLGDYEAALKKNGFEIVARVPNYVLMNDPVDAKGKFYPRVWNTLTSISRRSKALDGVIWPVLYPLEMLLTSVYKESPAQEIMVCRAR